MMDLNDTISAFQCCTQSPPQCSECPLTGMYKWNRIRDKCKNELKLSVFNWLKAQTPAPEEPGDITHEEDLYE